MTEQALPSQDREILRQLAARASELASLPVMAERKKMWKSHNSLRRVRPMVLIFPEGGWRELIPLSSLQCQDSRARNIERQLRQQIYTSENFRSDNFIDGQWLVGPVTRNTGWGFQQRWRFSEDPTGAKAFDPVILEPADLKKLRYPEITYDEAATEATFAFFQELFGGVLPVRRCGIKHMGFHLMQIYTGLRGLEQVMMDMIENPSMLHDAMAFLAEGHRRILARYVELNLLDLNNDNSYHASGGNGWTDELPKAGFDPARVRPCDMWASAESQELAQVSPAMHAEFALQYEKSLLEPFGLNGYGCCEDLTHKLDDVLTIPNIRRISISPFSDVEACAARLQDKYVFSWKPHPAMLAGEFNPQRIGKYIRHALDSTRGCVIEVILKDTHTCDNQPERFRIWSEIAMELAEQY